MSFKLSDDAKDYFDGIEDNSTTGGFDTMWDMYYLSAMIGIKARERMTQVEEPSAEPFIDKVIADYEDQKYEIYASLIMAEIERQNIPKQEEAEIRELMLDILDSRDPTRLSSDGKTLLNCYAERGFRILQNKIPTPGDFDLFLKQYHSVLESV